MRIARRVVAVLLVGCVSAAAVGSLALRSRQSSSPLAATRAGTPGTEPTSLFNEDVVRLVALRRIDFAIPPDRLKSLVQRLSLPPDKPTNASRWLHVARVLGAETYQLTNGNRVRAIDLFCDSQVSEKYFGASVLGVSRYGIRYRAAGDGAARSKTQEVHRDQVLGVFAEMGIPLSTPLTLKDRTFHLRDVLEDSIANFHLDQDELEWSALAYTLYMPHRTKWENKFGQSFSFDDLAHALLSRSLENKPCAGTHVLWALLAMYRSDAILSMGARSAVRDRLSRFVSTAVSSQENDGSWNVKWYESKTVPLGEYSYAPDDAIMNRLLATGHLTEWMLYVPEEFRVPHNTLFNAANWLYATLESQAAESDQRFCPISHATRVLVLMSGPEPREAIAASISKQSVHGVR